MATPGGAQSRSMEPSIVLGRPQPLSWGSDAQGLVISLTDVSETEGGIGFVDQLSAASMATT